VELTFVYAQIEPLDLGALLPLFWFAYHLWNEWHFQHEREIRFTGRTATDGWTSSPSNRETPGRNEAAVSPLPLQAAPQAASVDSPTVSPALPPHSSQWQIQVLRNAGYTVGYSPKARLPLWVFFRLDTSHPLFPLYRRPHIEFYPDERVSDPVYSNEYTRSGYQRGHMATSATIGIYFGSAAQAETFRLTNVVPQVGWNYEGIWNSLERIECGQAPTPEGVGLSEDEFQFFSGRFDQDK
jgi:DNA/RNA endonuclease G (NUC1)